ncbi:beta-Ala-His dipeptidase [Gynuella sp.]|uniref:beta-Ala-His dipeptidase n=1 Tax=Gynuella sp. TaxID=2969146 RepID=UPI003D0CBADD
MKPDHFPASPAHLFEHFYQFSQIPRASGQEQQVRQYCLSLAKERGLETRMDSAGNLVIYVPASAGFESRPTVIIQNHLDMVTVKTDDKTHDFATDPLQLQITDGWLTADRTTLGADNGIGCAAALAVMTDPEVQHPALELLFTVEEETGLFGASGLDATLLSGTRLLNLDTEDWGEFFIGCAGGKGWRLERTLDTEAVPADHVGLQLELKGLTGGHSGIQIHHQLGNANKLLAQWLHRVQSSDVRLAAYRSGVAHNVISREGQLVITAPQSLLPQLEQLSQQLSRQWLSYLPDTDHHLTLTLSATEMPEAVLTAPAQKLFIQALQLFPHGAQSYNLQQPADLVDLSANLAKVSLDQGQWSMDVSMRFFNAKEAETLVDHYMALAELFSLQPKTLLDYPGWQPDFESGLLLHGKQVYQEIFGAEPATKAIHAGLECGIIKSKKPDVDMLSFGPTIKGAHSPTERLNIATVEPFWTLLRELLKTL